MNLIKVRKKKKDVESVYLKRKNMTTKPINMNITAFEKKYVMADIHETYCFWLRRNNLNRKEYIYVNRREHLQPLSGVTLILLKGYEDNDFAYETLPYLESYYYPLRYRYRIEYIDDLYEPYLKTLKEEIIYA